MKLWLISQDKNTGYDTYDSAVVIAETEEEARLIHPAGGLISVPGRRTEDWVSDPKDVKAECIGEAKSGLELWQVVLASFNAG